MTVDEFRTRAASYRIHPQIDIDGDLNEGARQLIEQAFAGNQFVRFTPSTDRRVLREETRFSFLGETLMEAIVAIENETSIAFSLTETDDDGINVSFEYMPRDLTWEGVIHYRRTHPEPRISNAVHC